MKRNRGVTLIELAIVLIVIGVLLGLGAGIVGILTKKNKYMESKEIVSANLEGISGFVTVSGRLPATETELLGSIRSARDSYGKFIMYIYSSNLAGSSSAICNETSTNITIKSGCRDTACTSFEQQIDNIAYLVVSGNGNYNLQTWNSSLTSVTSSTVIIGRADIPLTLNIYTYGLEVDDYMADVLRTEPYDDIVKWVSLYELKVKAGCTAPGGGGGGCPYTTIEIVNTDTRDYFYSTSSATCVNWPSGSDITLNSGDILRVYTSWIRCFLGRVRDSITFSTACSLDTSGNNNGQICYDGNNFIDC